MRVLEVASIAGAEGAPKKVQAFQARQGRQHARFYQTLGEGDGNEIQDAQFPVGHVGRVGDADSRRRQLEIIQRLDERESPQHQVAYLRTEPEVKLLEATERG
eukprot:752999-Hanusia_phi.AAC.2